MRTFVILWFILILTLTACSGQTGLATEPALPATGTEEVPSVVAEITDSPEMEATATPDTEATARADAEPDAGVTQAVAPTPGSGVVTYSLVPEESTVTYEVGETFIDEGNVFNLAVGETQGVTGDIQVNFDRPQDSTLGTLVIDITGLRSDSQRRDNAIRDRFLQSSRYPTVTFTPTAIEGLPEVIEPGVEYPLTLRGDLTIRDTTRPAVFDARVRLQDEALTGQATTTVLMSDYGFGPIDILGMLKTEDEVKIRVDFVALPRGS